MKTAAERRQHEQLYGESYHRRRWQHLAIERGQRIEELEDTLRRIIGDFDRRRARPWGRFLLWLLRRTT